MKLDPDYILCYPVAKLAELPGEHLPGGFELSGCHGHSVH